MTDSMDIIGDKKLTGAFLYWMESSTDRIFADYSAHVLDRRDETKRRIFVDRGAQWLFVAHADTVQKPKIGRVAKKTIHGAGFDDRLGCYLAANLSQRLGADLLLTDLEEHCRSTAKHHKPKEDYRFVVEFDRAGTDVVTYDKDNADFRKSLSEFWKLGFGSYSDVSVLETPACCVNIGIGYHDAHGKDSYFKPAQTRKQAALFLDWFEKNKGTAFVADFRKPCNSWMDGYGLADYHDSYHDPMTKKFDVDICEVCGIQQAERVYDYYICEDCVRTMLNKILIS